MNPRFAVNADYFDHLRLSLLCLARSGAKKILEIGCGRGQSLAYLKNELKADFLVGVELNPDVAAAARIRPEISEVLTGDIEQLQLSFPDGYFDLVVAGHVLEHVRDPWLVLERLRRMLSSKGQLIGSLPNVRNIKVSLPLLFRGKWEYESSGILDWTHTKFFTRATILDLLRSTGFRPDAVTPEFAPKLASLNKMSLGFLSDLLCYTYNFSATPVPLEVLSDAQHSDSRAVGERVCS